jgi:hypothetical protein
VAHFRKGQWTDGKRDIPHDFSHVLQDFVRKKALALTVYEDTRIED